ncbi:hypothetical protein [Hymenobacter norwichensis]|uniref:hypothetical protein n=1 Tax=Hymenobacter norwichensis TaxID=223903 RepID=UPI0003B5F654|nr:hypothetical protein [Hymenobacter norwichensis]
MERIIRLLLIGWLLLLGGVLLAYHYGYSLLAYRLLWAVAIGSPAVVLALLVRVGLGLRDAWHRVRVLRRARRWRRRQQPNDQWMNS